MSETPASRPPRRLLVPDARYQRRASDVVRLAGIVVALVVVALVTRSRGSLEGSFGRFVLALPNWLSGVFEFVYSSGSSVVVGILLLLVLAHRRWRLALAVVLASVLSTAVVLWLHRWLDPGAVVPVDVAEVRSFPLRRLALPIAIFLALRPYLVRPVRRVFDTVVVLTVVSAVLTPAGLPLDVVAGLLVGWGAATATALLLGSPEGQPTIDEVRYALAELGVDAVDVRPATRHVWGHVLFDATERDGTGLELVVIGRDATDAQLLAKAWRSIWFRDTGPDVTFNRQHRVELLAYKNLLAREHGVRVPDVLAAGLAGTTRLAMVVTRRPSGEPLLSTDGTDTSTADVSDAALGDLWRSVASLRRARIAHGSLSPDRIVVDHDHAVIVDFARGSTSAPVGRLDVDLAEALVSTAIVVGAERAVAALEAELGDDGLLAVLPVLQPAALSAATRDAVDSLKPLLGSLREAIAARTGADPPEPAELRRVSVGDAVTLGLTFFGVSMVLGFFAEIEWSEVRSALEGASWGWVIVAAAVSLLPAVTDAIATMGGLGPHLPLGPLVMMNYAGRFINIAVPSSAGQAAVSIRFAQRQGIEPGAAISGGMVIGFAGFVVQVLIISIGLFTGLVDLDLELSFSADRVGLWVFVIVLLAVSVAFALRASIRLRTWFDANVRPQIAEFRRGLRDIVDDPRRIAMLLAGNIGSQLLFAAMLTASLLAFGADGKLFVLALLANTGASVFAGLVPVPGGVGVWEGTAAAILVAGGIDPAVATVAVLVHRLITFYLSPLYGWFAFANMRRRDYL